jgi:hypothetical protein
MGWSGDPQGRNSKNYKECISLTRIKMALYNAMEQEIHISHIASFEIFLLIYTCILKDHVYIVLIDLSRQLIIACNSTLEIENVYRIGKQHKPAQT